MDRVKNYFVPPSHVPNWTSRQNCFLAVILSRLVLKNMTVKWLKKAKLFALPKFGSLRGSTSASLKIGEIIVFPAEAEYSYFSADFRLKIFL